MEIWFIILDRFLLKEAVIQIQKTVDSVDDITWFANRSTSSLPLIPVCEGTNMNSMVFDELAIMLIIC